MGNKNSPLARSWVRFLHYSGQRQIDSPSQLPNRLRIRKVQTHWPIDLPTLFFPISKWPPLFFLTLSLYQFHLVYKCKKTSSETFMKHPQKRLLRNRATDITKEMKFLPLQYRELWSANSTPTGRPTDRHNNKKAFWNSKEARSESSDRSDVFSKGDF